MNNVPSEGEGKGEDRVIAALEEIARWIRFLGIRDAKDTLSKAMTNEPDRAIYALSDGRSSRDIAKILGTNHTVVGRRWAEWHSQGLMRDSRRFKGRREAVFAFEELGLPLPERVAAMRKTAVEPAEDVTEDEKGIPAVASEPSGSSEQEKKQ